MYQQDKLAYMLQKKDTELRYSSDIMKEISK